MAWISATASASTKRVFYACLLLALGLATPVFGESAVVVGVESGTFQKAELAKIQKALGIVVGKPLDMERLDAGIRAVHDAGKIQTLFVDAAPEGGGVRLSLRGTLQKRLRNVTFNNMSPKILSDVKRKFKLEKGELADTRVFTQLRERLKRDYEADGYNFSDVQIVINDVPDTDEADVEITVAHNQPMLVNRVHIAGASPELAEPLKDLVKLKKGDRFVRTQLEESTDAINRYLRANGYPTSRVEDTQLTYSPDKLSCDITISLKLGERFQFVFSGNTVFDDETLRELLTEEVLSQTDAPEKIAALIEHKYRLVGYHFVKVRPRSTVDTTARANIVRFEISEGKKVLIDRLSFNGAEEAGGEKLETIFYRGASGVLARGIYCEELIPEAVQNMQRDLALKGYLSALVTGPKPVFSEDKKGVQIFFDVDLGTRTFLTAVEIKGATALSKAKIENAMNLKIGEPLNREKVEEGRRALIQKYQSEGYADVKLADEGGDWLVLSSDRKGAVVKVNLVEGTRYVVGSVRIEGARKTKSEVILREMLLKTGDTFDPAKLRQSEENIGLLGIFSRWEIVSTVNPATPNRKDLTIYVKEMRAGLGEVGIGGYYEDPILRAKGFLSLAYRNLGGTNQTASLRSEVALPYDFTYNRFPFVEYAETLGYRAPYPFQLPLTFTAQVGFDSYEISYVPLQLQTRARVDAGVQKKLSKKLTAIYHLFHFERTNTQDLDSASLATTSFTLESIGSTGPGIILDLRDDPFNPTKGSYHTLDLEYAHPAIIFQGDGFEFTEVLSRNTFFVPLLSPFSFTGFIGFGAATSLNSSNLPTARLLNDLSLGGQNSIRGFNLRQFSPNNFSPLPHNAGYWNARAELASYLFANISAAVFYDSGQILPDWRPQRREDGVGIGFRYKTPVGPVVIDVAQGLGPDKQAVMFYFTVGTL